MITVFVRTLEDLTGTMWHNFVKYVWSSLWIVLMLTIGNVSYNSKKATGFTHLQGEHACFLDSLVQSLYCTGSFRHV